MRPGQTRIDYLDGLRGLAIMWVMAWHYTAPVYAASFPYGTAYARIPVLDHGWAGVNLFFLISGFVILLTLERCTGFAEFMARRWRRLFPAMLIASLLVFAASQVIGSNMPHGRAEPVSLLPGLTFLSPPFWTLLLGRPVGELDGVYWTLYVEMGFYLIFGMLYFLVGWRRAVISLAALWLAVVIASRLAAAVQSAEAMKWIEPLQWLGIEYFGWFVSGALFLKARELSNDRLFVAALIAGLVSALTSGLWQPDDWTSCGYLVGCLAVFAGAQRFSRLQRVLATKLLLFAGFVSYPLYLLHNELGVGLIATFMRDAPQPFWPLLAPVMMMVMLSLAWLVVSHGEGRVLLLLRPLLSSVIPRQKQAAPKVPVDKAAPNSTVRPLRSDH
jgi:peptidoglycan/LPS O-acetylase OafA/YrhL